MSQVSIKQMIEAPVSDVWKSWDDFANIANFNPNLNRSFLINDNGETGLGATRQCDLSDGKSYIQERIVEYIPERKIAVDVFNGTLPLKSAKAEIEMRAMQPNQTELTFTMHFVPKMGLIGRLMLPLLRPQLVKMLGLLVEGNRAYVEDGVIQNAA